MEFSFAGRVASVTGAAQGFGRAISDQVSRHGAAVWACDIRADDLAETAQLCRDHGGCCEVRLADVTDEGQVTAFVDEVAAAAGVLFFASDYAAWCTGQVLSIDGGKAMF